MRPTKLLPQMLALALLTGCATATPGFDGAPTAYGPARERQIFHALRRLKAEPTQRAAVLAAFDATDPRLKMLGAQDAEAQARLRALDIRGADYLSKVAPIADQRATLLAERLRVEAEFSRAVAASLSEDQWQTWAALFRTRDPGWAIDDGFASDEDGAFGGGRRR